jgi:carotenoid 1,2-hydratase
VSDGGPEFDAPVAPGGYRWWYVDALSDDGQFGLTIIAFIGSVFSPYYAWSGWADPFRHCAINVALYGPRGARWAMTERGADSLRRSHDFLAIGPSALAWRDGALVIAVDEFSAPIPRRIRGEIVVAPEAINRRQFTLEAAGGHVWRPIAPLARVSVKLEAPELSWNGHAYLDTNAGDEPLEKGFSFWTWSRAKLGDGAAIFYDAERRREDPLSLALRFDAAGDVAMIEAPRVALLPKTKWRVPRRTRSDDGSARVLRSFEDTPFYSRSLVAGRFAGAQAEWVNESLSLDRFAHPIVRLMLPFRMPRRG